MSAGRPELDGELRIVAGNPSDEELAAATAVLREAVSELAADDSPIAVTGPSDWERSARVLRSSIVPAPGAWKRS